MKRKLEIEITGTKTKKRKLNSGECFWCVACGKEKKNDKLALWNRKAMKEKGNYFCDLCDKFYCSTHGDDDHFPDEKPVLDPNEFSYRQLNKSKFLPCVFSNSRVFLLQKQSKVFFPTQCGFVNSKRARSSFV